MCILLALGRDAEPGSLWIAANRDEDLGRPWQPPRLLLEPPRVFGGRDLVGGGSWLAVNLDAGFVVAVTNARLGAKPRERSRGRLVLDLASAPALPEALARLRTTEWATYGEFNLFLGDSAERWLATNHPGPAVRKADGAVVALGNDALDAPGERVLAAAVTARSMTGIEGDTLEEALRTLLADHGGADPLCRHGERYGTVCSTVLALSGREISRYSFAPGNPCVTPFSIVALPRDGG